MGPPGVDVDPDRQQRWLCDRFGLEEGGVLLAEDGQVIDARNFCRNVWSDDWQSQRQAHGCASLGQSELTAPVFPLLAAQSIRSSPPASRQRDETEVRDRFFVGALRLVVILRCAGFWIAAFALFMRAP